MKLNRRETSATAWPPSMTVETCWMCGLQLPVQQLVPDGGNACADVRWYCQDAAGCTQRWTSQSRVARVSW